MAAESTIRLVFLGDSAAAVRSVRTLEGTLGSVARTAKVAAGALLLGVGGALAFATKEAIGFDRSMRNVNSIAKLSEIQFQSLSKRVLALAKDTGQGPKTLADGLYDIVSSGFKANQAITILHASAKAATAGLTDTATSTKAIVAVLNAYHLSAQKATSVSNTLFQEVNLGVNTFEELASQIGDTAPQAAALKIPFDQVAAALATITLHGTSMAEASTQVARILTALVKPSKGLSAELKNMGFETGQAAVQALGFTGVIRRLSADAGGNQQKLAAWLKDIRGIRGVINLTGDNLKTFTDNVEKMGAAQEGVGATQKAFAEQAKSISFQWQRAKAALAAAAIPIGQLLFPALSKAAGALGDFAGWITKINAAPDLSGKLKIIGGGFDELANSIRRAVLGYREFGTAHVAPLGGGPAMVPKPYNIVHSGIAQQIGDEISKVDWGSVGKKIVDGISAGLAGGVKLAESLANIISTGVQQVDWPSIVGKLGPALALAMASAFATLTDPTFWIHHWQLALAVAVVAFGGAIGRVAKPIAELFGRLAGDAVLALAERLPRGVQTVFLDAVVLAGRALRGIVSIVRGVIADVLGFLNPFGARMTRLLVFTLKVLGIEAAISTIEHWATSAISAVERVAHRIESAIGGAFENAWGWLHRAWDWIIHIRIPVPHFKTWHGIPTDIGVTWEEFAKGGTVSGQEGQPVLVLAHAGEMILNKAQQAALGGTHALARMFGFGGSFASGGVVPPGAHGHATPNHHGTGGKLQAVTAAGKAAFAAVARVTQRESDLQQAYDLLGRAYSIEQTYHPVVITDPVTGNQSIDSGELAKQLAEIDGLIRSRQHMLGLVAEEKARLQEAVTALKAAIQALLKAIAEAREAAQREAQQIQDLQAEVAQIGRDEADENHRYSQSTGGKMSPAARTAARHQHEATMFALKQRKTAANANIKRLTGMRQAHVRQVSSLGSEVSNLRGDLGQAQQRLFHGIGFDRQGYVLDILDLEGQRGVLASTSVAPASGGGGPGNLGGGGGGGGSLGGAIASGTGQGALQAALAAALATIGRLNLALGIQATQAQVLGSFQKGTLHVPATGLYQLHAGEAVTPAGRAAMSGSDHPPVVVQIHESGDIGGVIDRRIVANTPRISVMQGQSAERLRREGRF